MCSVECCCTIYAYCNVLQTKFEESKKAVAAKGKQLVQKVSVAMNKHHFNANGS